MREVKCFLNQTSPLLEQRDSEHTKRRTVFVMFVKIQGHPSTRPILYFFPEDRKSTVMITLKPEE